MSFSQVMKKLEKDAAKIPPLKREKSPGDYFKISRSLLKKAGQYKKSEQYEAAFVNLRRYLIVVYKRIKVHPDINNSEYTQELQFNLEKAGKMRSYEIEYLKYKISKKHGGSFPKPRKGSSNNKRSSKGLPVPKKKEKRGSWFSNMFSGTTDKVQEKLIENENVQQYVGNQVSKLAQNEMIQEQTAKTVKKYSEDEGFQETVGNFISESTDNEYIKKLATDKTVQRLAGAAIANTVGNKEVQRKVGQAVSRAATDRELQKKVAKGGWEVGKGGWKIGKFVGKIALKGGKLAYENRNELFYDQEGGGDVVDE